MSAAAEALDSRRYRIVRLLGRGGLGEVYLARDLTLERDVAIKFVSPDTLEADARRRVLREARAAASLDHPGICGVYETGEDAGGRSYIVMQYVEGETLASVLTRGALPVRDALALAVQIAEALAAAHRRGVVHRDLKPGNVMVTPSGLTKLVDFGIAKIVLSREERADAPTTTVSTTARHVVGTPAYMSPEQIQQRPVDGRTDLFALGQVLFECLTGRRAFGGRTPLETMSNILHVHPPAPSSVRPELTSAHDELCRRLLAKDPADRFQSADEVVGAIRLLLPDTSRAISGEIPQASGRWRGRPKRLGLAAAVLTLAGLSAAVWMWDRGNGLPPVPEESDLWYRRGNDAMPQGAYHTAQKDFDRAVTIFPRHALAHGRLAEVAMELDDPQAAQAHLLRVSAIVPDQSRLPSAERLRLEAVRAQVLRDVDGAITLYRSLAAQNPGDPQALTDLGRAQEAAGRRADARATYAQAIAANPQYAAAYLRLGTLEGFESQWKPALAAFAEAEQLYKASSDGEGETEVRLNRGAMFDAMGDPKAARLDLEQAQRLASTATSTFQMVRIQLALSIVTASEGRIDEAERIATAAVNDALANGFETVAAGGLVDLAATLLFASKGDLAEHQLEQALQLAKRRGATLTAARAKVQLAEVYSRGGRTSEALALIEEVLPFLRNGRYRRVELTALSIAAGAHDRAGNLDEARTISSEVLAVADAMGDEPQAAVAASSLASVTAALGGFPEALRLRERAGAIHRRQNDKASLPYDLTNRADLLIRLGRPAEAETLLRELDAGIAAGLEPYIGRQRRATFLRALSAAIALRCGEVPALLDRLDPKTQDSAAQQAPAVRAFCAARTGRRAGAAVAATDGDADKTAARERQYWRAAAALQLGHGAEALAEANRGLSLLGTVANDELRWRLAAVAAAAARQRRDASTGAQMSATAREALQRVRAAWKTDVGAYEQRPDLVELRKKEQS